MSSITLQAPLPRGLPPAIHSPLAIARQNQLLAKLADEEQMRWLPLGETVDLARGQVLGDAGSAATHVYFPTTAIVSLLCLTADGASSEVAMVGREGAVGLSALMGGGASTCCALVQSAGQAVRFRAPSVKDEFARGGVMMGLMLRYMQSLLSTMAQTALCNRHHSLDRQLCRWLLLSLDRHQGAELAMTQELIAHLLGVRREGVTEGALKLQSAGLIRYARGRISVLDRGGLEARSCECYAVMRREYELPTQQ